MSDKNIMTIDGIPVEIKDEKNLLELIRKVGIKMPTFCYYSELSIHGACRMCMVENEKGVLSAACSEKPRAGMQIQTNTERLRKYRKNILELMLANHCRDCTTCQNSGKCKLQDLAMRYNIEGVRFPNTACTDAPDASSPCITKDMGKCILCGDCVRMCNEVQGVGAIDFSHRGSKMRVSTAFDIPMADSTCVGCGQCAAVCPTGAITVRNSLENVWKDLDDKNTTVSVQVAPAVRVALGESFGLTAGDNVIGKIVSALRRMGFDKVYDTSTAADITVLEESAELAARLEKNEKMPLFTSCCPAWIRYCEKMRPELLEHISTCRSPMQMFASIIKEEAKGQPKRAVHVAIMPCSAKKFEAVRDEFKRDGIPDVDHVITTQELIRMIKESGLIFPELEAEAVDAPFGMMTGAGVIFGVTGGVTEAALRTLAADKSSNALQHIAMVGVRGFKGVKEASVMLGDREVKIAVVSGLGNASKLIDSIEAGEKHYDFVEVMACPGGCVSGAGQPYAAEHRREKRGTGLYSADKLCSVKRSEDNLVVKALYDGILKGKAHELLHVSYTGAKHGH